MGVFTDSNACQLFSHSEIGGVWSRKLSKRSVRADMKTTGARALKASAIAIALLGSVAIVATVTVPDFAYAKEGKGNGGGKGGGNGNGGDKGGGKGNSGDKGGKGNSAGGKDGKGKSGGSGAAKNDGKKASARPDRASSKPKGSGTKSSKRKGFSLKELFGGKKNRTRTAKARQKTVRTTRKAVETVAVTRSIRPEARAPGDSIAELLGAHPSELGALNAANASETALRNASPNSRVGRIAAYRDTVLAGDELRDDLQEAEDHLDGLEPPDRPSSEVESDLDVALDDVQRNKERVAELEQDLADAGGSDPEIEADLETAKSDLQDSVDIAKDLKEERQAAVEYEDKAAEVEDLTELVEDQADTEREALENAANKPVTDEVEATVKSILGL
ncbi:hypothetical protein Q5Y75_21470 [Ruegeria sp. 2205SS24-7]|uniref:hypothetical protein n=1 Tax=Ruegeria discodermiae TaxID=3064389 RepID=UPI0027407CB0|nr:hypothetical protein [Ruegeria sp. 2205SS24-7]MDP5219800.1 hypothetical protein [Ruegeria sp. 2205SS24-7]